MQALRIDPLQRTVRSIDVALVDIMDMLSANVIATVDIAQGHCLVIDDSEDATDHPIRYRFAGDNEDRPFFGPALIFGMANGHWSPATLGVADVDALLIWEEWSEADAHFVSLAEAVEEA